MRIRENRNVLFGLLVFLLLIVMAILLISIIRLNSEPATAEENETSKTSTFAPTNRNIPSKSTTIKMPIENKGIKNNGLSCFANSVFQCINSLDTLRNYFLECTNKERKVSSEIKSVLRKLNRTNFIDIKDNLTNINNSPGFRRLNLTKMNDVEEFYQELLNSAIKEECGFISNKEFIILNDNFFKKTECKDSFLIKNCLINREGRDRNIPIISKYYPFIVINYVEGIDIESTIYNDFFNEYNLASGGNSVLAVLVENAANDATLNVTVKEKIMFGGKNYTLKSFCVNKGGHNGHYIARVVLDRKLIEYDDDRVSYTDLNLSKPQGRVRLIFYEAK